MTKIVRVIDKTEDGESYSYLAYDGDMDGDIIDDNPALTIEEVANFCDRKAEARNNHDYVGIHRILAVLLYKHVPTQTLIPTVYSDLRIAAMGAELERYHYSLIHLGICISVMIYLDASGYNPRLIYCFDN
mgnify:CR=1 FL=1